MLMLSRRHKLTDCRCIASTALLPSHHKRQSRRDIGQLSVAPTLTLCQSDIVAMSLTQPQFQLYAASTKCISTTLALLLSTFSHLLFTFLIKSTILTSHEVFSRHSYIPSFDLYNPHYYQEIGHNIQHTRIFTRDETHAQPTTTTMGEGTHGYLTDD